jgi:hypothetical protein
MGCAKPAVLTGLMRTLGVSAVAVALYALSYVLHEAKVLPSFLYVDLDLGQNVGFYEGHVQFALNSISSMLFLVPFLLAALLVWPAEMRPPISRPWLWIAFILCVVPVILSERKALWILMLSSPLITLAFRQFLPDETRSATRRLIRNALIGIAVATVILMLYLRIAYNFDFGALANVVTEAFNFGGGTSDDVIGRRNQFISMMREWETTPLFGTGFGAAASYIRSTEQPWAYELTYVAMLFHAGVAGLLLYAAAVAWIFVNAIRVIQTDPRLGPLLLPVMVGTTAFLIGNASNPYLEKYDYIWVLFLPIAFINLWLIRRPRP